MKNDTKPDFSMIMASTVHDMKNSLSMLLNSLETICDDLPDEWKETHNVATIQYEAERVNNDLIQLLGLYRLEHDQLSTHIDEQFVRDFLDEQEARYEALLNARNITLEVECDNDLVAYFDRDMVGGILNNALTNAARYSKDKVKLSAYHEDQFLVLEIADNGGGYPPSMCKNPGEIFKGIDFTTGSTSLGLYFAMHVAELHKQGDHRGYILLDNGGELGGGIFKIYLP
jgi:signal transduction histidine kinase